VKKAGETMKTSTDDANYQKQLLFIIIVLGLTVSILMGIFISRKISNPIKNLTISAEKLAAGDMNIEIKNDSKDEVGTLSRTFEIMAEKIALQIQYLENIPSPVVVVNKDFSIQYINKSGADVLGKQSGQLISKKCYDQFKTSHCCTENCALQKAMTFNNIYTEETVAHLPGIDLPILYTGAPIKNKKGEIIGAIECVTPIKEMKDMQDYLNRCTLTMMDAMEKFADGDLTVKVTPEKKDDNLAKLFLSFNSAVNEIGDIIKEVNDAIEATASASAQISASAEEMAAGAHEQSSQTFEVASAIEQMTKTIIETTLNTGKTSDSAKNAGSMALEGGRIVDETIQGMNKVADVVRKSAETVQSLGRSTDQIGNITQVIDDIADQTNLLALNAAIEAARAGEQGRGFAVVADEVRKLAERTTNATKEIASMIKQIQKETEGAVLSMEKGTAEVEKGMHLADKAGESLRNIIKSSQEVENMSMQVAAASEEQSTTAEQISRNIDGINNVSQESAAGVQQIAKAAEDLNRLTHNLQKMVSRFRTEYKHQNEKSQLSERPNGTIY
ncbi:MAG: methyl-accepting chemotaxis protein, partial [Methanococcaceae archaeon]